MLSAMLRQKIHRSGHCEVCEDKIGMELLLYTLSCPDVTALASLLVEVA